MKLGLQKVTEGWVYKIQFWPKWKKEVFFNTSVEVAN